jgi:hypothetical protein
VPEEPGWGILTKKAELNLPQDKPPKIIAPQIANDSKVLSQVQQARDSGSAPIRRSFAGTPHGLLMDVEMA